LSEKGVDQVVNPGKKARLTEFGVLLDSLLAKLEKPMTITDYSDLTDISYKYISQLRTKPDRRPGSYAIVRLLKPFVDFGLLTLSEALRFSKITRGKILTIRESRVLFPTISEEDLLQTMNTALRLESSAVNNLMEVEIIENDYSVPVKVIEYIGQQNPQVVKMIENSATYGRHYIDTIKTLDSKVKKILLLIRNPFGQPISGLQKERTCAQIRTLKLVDFKNNALKIRCYNQPASLRGRKFDNDLIILGWYTYYYDPDYPEYGKTQIWGHSNPLIVSHLRKENISLGEMFDRVFDFLWNDTGSTSLLNVCKGCELYQAGNKSARSDKGCSVSEDWLKRVSG
jgi:hypothetical protein